MIETIQVCLATANVPPSSFKGYCTVTAICVIVLIFGRERSAKVIVKRITSSSWINNNGKNKNVIWVSMRLIRIKIFTRDKGDIRLPQ